MGAQTETELKEKKLRVEDALNATKVNAKSCLNQFVSFFGIHTCSVHIHLAFSVLIIPKH